MRIVLRFLQTTAFSRNVDFFFFECEKSAGLYYFSCAGLGNQQLKNLRSLIPKKTLFFTPNTHPTWYSQGLGSMQSLKDRGCWSLHSSTPVPARTRAFVFTAGRTKARARLSLSQQNRTIIFFPWPESTVSTHYLPDGWNICGSWWTPPCAHRKDQNH